MTKAAPPSRRRGRLSFRRLVLLATALLLGFYLARGWGLPGLARFLDVSEPPRSVNCVFVLGGGAQTRPFVAAALVRAGLAHRVLLPSIQLSSENESGLSPSENELLRRVLLARGVPDERLITLPGLCGSTLDEAHALANYLEAEPNTTVAVVTNGFHTRRARLLFRRALGEKAKQVHFVAAPDDHFRPETWWRTENGFVTYADEYGKLLLCTFR